MLKVLVIAVYSLALRELLQVGQLDWMHTSYKQSFDVFAAKFQVSPIHFNNCGMSYSSSIAV